MPSGAKALQHSSPTTTPPPVGSLRSELEARREAGRRFEVREVMAVVVPLCTQLADLHAAGKTLYVYPSSLHFAPSGAVVVELLAQAPPTHPRDRCCLAPEERRGAAGDARASVFAIGAILYEMLTGAVVGPGMRRPSELVRGLSPSLEGLLGKALVADPAHRPADLRALAQALHHVAPNASIAPPPADESHLDHDETFDVDVSLSMLPPPPSMQSESLRSALQVPRVPAFQAAQQAPVSPRAIDPTKRLADLKAALEADPRPRYVVIKSGMDHGPFTAVELLQQLATGAFGGSHSLRDAFSDDERLISAWEEFAPFADQAKLHREIVQEKKAIEAASVAEKKGSQYKTLIAATVIGVLAAGGAGYWYKESAARDRALTVQADTAVAVDVDGGLGAGKGPGKKLGSVGARGPGPVAGGGNVPIISDRGSCEAAINAYSEEYKIGNDGAPPDFGAADYGAVLNRGGYMSSCGVPSSMEVNVCVAVQNGRAIGVTVTTSPPNPTVSRCIAGGVRGLSFPSHPRMDVARTTFAAN